MSFVWDNSYTIGINEIDGQHEAFVNLLNRVSKNYENMSESLKNDEEKMKMYLDILNLRKYALYHFLSEENYMISSKYPKYFDHKKQHDAFIKKIFELEEEVFCSLELSPQKLITFMLSWFQVHIQKVDKEFGNYYKMRVGVKS